MFMVEIGKLGWIKILGVINSGPKLQLWDVVAKLFVFEVCMEIFTTALRNKNTVKFSINIPNLTSTVHRLLLYRLLIWKEPILASYSFLGLLHK